jgi:SAM-dependent methyltransferase
VEPLVVSGERFIPEAMSGQIIDAEHQSRYRMAARYVQELRVLDAGCGVGWGGQILLDAGASSVVGVDIDPAAVADAVRRVPGALFTVGDLAALPLATASVDVVVCFEAIEHVDDPYRALDELARVLAPGGSLLVSSPNPAVYPPGNEFHIHEFPPHELLDAVVSRLGEGRLVRQQVLLASLLIERDDDREPSDIEAVIRTVVPLATDHDRYSMVVTGKAGANLGPATVLFSPSTQLDDLEALVARLTAERAELHDHLAAALAAAEHHVAEVAAAERQLVDADRRFTELAVSAERQLADADRRLTELAAEVELTRSALHVAQSHGARTATERDRLAADLVRVEQALARADLARPVVPAAPVADTLERDALTAEIDAMRVTLSWRVTRPLRWVRRRVPPR